MDRRRAIHGKKGQRSRVLREVGRGETLSRSQQENESFKKCERLSNF